MATKRLPGCYAEFITFAILLGNRINQGPFIGNWKKGKKNSRQSWRLQYCQYLKKENSYLDKSGEQRKP